MTTLLSVAFAAALFATTDASANRRPASIVVEPTTGAILSRNRSRVVLHPASLTKMMTLYLAFDALERGRLRWDQNLVTSRHAASMPPSELGLRRGDRVTVGDAILGSAVKSANDAAVVLAEAISGTESAFARLMTATARGLGMRRTTFRNASGLTAEGHVSTAEDMAILARALMTRFPERMEIFSRTSVRIRGRRYRTTNTLLGRVRGVDGLKTGYTRRAGHNLAATSTRGNRRVLVVVMNERRRILRDRRVTRLIEAGDAMLRRGGWRDRPRLPQTAPQRRRTPPQDLVAAIGNETPAPQRRPANLRSRQAPQQTIGDGGWAVQLGAFAERDAAAEMLASAFGETRGLFTGGAGALSRADVDGRALHRARVVGLEESIARRACQRLERQGRACALVPPTGWRDETN